MQFISQSLTGQVRIFGRNFRNLVRPFVSDSFTIVVEVQLVPPEFQYLLDMT